MKFFRANMKAELDLSDYAKKADLKKATSVTSDLLKKLI